MGIKISL